MNCPICNKSLPDYAQFCTNCGASLAQLPQQPQPVPVAPIQMEPPVPVKVPETIAEEKMRKSSGKGGLVAVLVIFAVLLIGSLAVNYLQMEKNQELEKDYKQVAGEVDEAERKQRRAENELLALEQETGEALVFLEFYEGNVAVLGDSGNMYHRYGCQYLDMNSFTIYSEDVAEFAGHTRCPYCHD